MDRSSRNGFNCIGKLTPFPSPPPFQNQSDSDLQRVHIKFTYTPFGNTRKAKTKKVFSFLYKLLRNFGPRKKQFVSAEFLISTQVAGVRYIRNNQDLPLANMMLLRLLKYKGGFPHISVLPLRQKIKEKRQRLKQPLFSLDIVPLKGVCHEIFYLHFFS